MTGALALEVPRWVAASKASVVVIENVPPFLASPQWRELAASLEALGYVVATWVLDAAEHGAPQLRRRAFTVASSEHDDTTSDAGDGHDGNGRVPFPIITGSVTVDLKRHNGINARRTQDAHAEGECLRLARLIASVRC